MKATAKRLLPFLRWFPVSRVTLRADLVAGLTVALVLVPQSMAYAQLAGMPAHYGLYAAFLPVIVAALFGSSQQLNTGPVAVVSLLTASSLAALAPPGSGAFIELAIMLSLVVGLFQLALGAFKLGAVVNFLSHPVIAGFTNAAALIIGLSQLHKLIGVPMTRSESFIQDIWGVARQIADTHLPTLLMGLAAIGLILAVRRRAPQVPGVLVAVVVTTLASWLIGFEQSQRIAIDRIEPAEIRLLIDDYAGTQSSLSQLEHELHEKTGQRGRLVTEQGGVNRRVVDLDHEIDLLRLRLHDRRDDNDARLRVLRRMKFEVAEGTDGAVTAGPRLYMAGRAPEGVDTDGKLWRLRTIGAAEVEVAGGGEVVGALPQGLPALSFPSISWGLLGSLLSTAIVIALVGFTEAISIAKAMAAKTRDRIDPDQELIGQGLANLAGAMTQAFPTSGSFSRSAVNLNAGARTGLSSVFSGLIVLLTLLFLTPLLYHLPQAVLAGVIIMAVTGLINVGAIRTAWKVNRADGVSAVATFGFTILAAPHLDRGILLGATLAILLYLYRTMRPRVAILGRFRDGTLRDVRFNADLPTSPHIIAMRFDGSLYFANIAYFEDAVLEAVAAKPAAKYLLIVGDAINELDASGEEVVHHLQARLQAAGVQLVFSGLKKQVLDVMRSTRLYEDLGGEKNIFATEDQAITAIYERLGDEAATDLFCPVDIGRRYGAAP